MVEGEITLFFFAMYACRIHQDCAIALQEKGDYDKAVKHYIDGTHRMCFTIVFCHLFVLLLLFILSLCRQRGVCQCHPPLPGAGSPISARSIQRPPSSAGTIFVTINLIRILDLCSYVHILHSIAEKGGHVSGSSAARRHGGGALLRLPQAQGTLRTYEHILSL